MNLCGHLLNIYYVPSTGECSTNPITLNSLGIRISIPILKIILYKWDCQSKDLSPGLLSSLVHTFPTSTSPEWGYLIWFALIPFRCSSQPFCIFILTLFCSCCINNFLFQCEFQVPSLILTFLNLWEFCTHFSLLLCKYRTLLLFWMYTLFQYRSPWTLIFLTLS